LSPAALISLH